MKKTYTVWAAGVVTFLTRVEASSVEEAREKALDRGTTGLYHNSQAESVESAWRLADGLDWEPKEEDIVDVEPCGS